MPEPTSTTAAVSLTGLLVVLIGPELGPLLGPLIGEFLLALAGALAGVLHPASRRPFTSWGATIAFVMLWILTALVLVGAVSATIEHYLAWPARSWPGAMAWAITFFADKWRTWLEPLGDALAAGAAALMPEWLRTALSRKKGADHDSP